MLYKFNIYEFDQIFITSSNEKEYYYDSIYSKYTDYYRIDYILGKYEYIKACFSSGKFVTYEFPSPSSY